MRIVICDFNNAQQIFASRFAGEWANVEAALTAIPIHLKESDQAGIQGTLIFDPVGTNSAIKTELEARGWSANIPMPPLFDFLGTDVDFVCNGVLAEVQFSNYPFLLNNVVRAELLFKSQTLMAGHPVGALVMITKGRMFPASNSTLYYEQAVKQLTELANNHVLDIPVRLVGLIADQGVVNATFTTYHTARYSRTVVRRQMCSVRIENGTSARSRCRITLVNP